jgi:hypothetical protein
MKNIKLYIGLLATALISLSSCKNDLDVLAPGEGTVSVYGVLNPNESVQNIRINKVYLTDGDALTAAQDANQTNYGPGEVSVYLERYLNGKQMSVLNQTLAVSDTMNINSPNRKISLTETVVVTSSGLFNIDQRIWQTNKKIFHSNEYKLIAKINSTGKEFTAQSVIIDSVKTSASKPFIYHPTLHPMHGNYITTGAFPTPLNAYVDYSMNSPTNVIKIKFSSIPNAKLYNVVMRFHYIDSLLSGPPDTTKYIDFNFPNLSSSSIAGGEPLEVSYVANDFYTNLGAELSKRTNAGIKKRRAFYMEYIIKAGAESLNTFLQVNAPSNTIAQDKPNYSNINGGVGIFSSISRSSITHDFSNAYIDNKICCHPSVFPYLFCKSDGSMPTGSCAP